MLGSVKVTTYIRDGHRRRAEQKFTATAQLNTAHVQVQPLLNRHHRLLLFFLISISPFLQSTYFTFVILSQPYILCYFNRKLLRNAVILWYYASFGYFKYIQGIVPVYPKVYSTGYIHIRLIYCIFSDIVNCSYFPTLIY